MKPMADKTIPEMRADLDRVKRMVAVALQHALVTGPDRPQKVSRPDEVVLVEGKAVTALTTAVRVTTQAGEVTSTRVFVIKMGESADTEW